MNKNKKMPLIGISGKAGVGKDLVGEIIQYLIARKYDNRDIKIQTAEFLGLTPQNWMAIHQAQTWKIVKFADKLKDIVCLLIGCTREQLEDRGFKETPLGEQWRVYKNLKTDKLGLKNTSNDSCETYILTPRLLLQLLGTQCGRDIIHPNIWVNSLFADYKPTNQSSPGRFTVNYPPEVDFIHNQDYDGDIERYLIYPNWIITDCRFPNEAQAIKDRGGINIRINRPCSVCGGVGYHKLDCRPSEHQSETALDDYEFNYVIENSGTIEELMKQVKEILIKEKII